MQPAKEVVSLDSQLRTSVTAEQEGPGGIERVQFGSITDEIKAFERGDITLADTASTPEVTRCGC